MFVFPISPIDPRTFFEDTIPALFAEWVLEERERAVDIKLGVVLHSAEDDEGGDWTLHFTAGELKVLTGRATDCDLTIVQSVPDWRSALWEGRPALIAEGVAAFKRSGPAGLRPANSEFEAGDPEALNQLSALEGLIEAVIAGDPGPDPAVHGDPAEWRIGVQLGTGPIRESPDATIQLGHEQAEAIRRGDLHPVEALITGQLRLEGDLGLIIQLQAIAMLAAPRS